MSIEDMHAVMNQDADLQKLKSYIIQGWSHAKDDTDHSIQRHWIIIYKLVMIDGIAMKSK